jgi:hypothetical protein
MATNIISTGYFIGEILIPTDDAFVPSLGNGLNAFITKYEAEYLKQALGYSFYKLFYADNYPTPATSRFQKLLNGNVPLGNAEWVDNQAVTHEWLGLNRTTENPIANYIYFWYQKNNATTTTPIGESKNKVENSSTGSPVFKLMRGWNVMNEITCEMHEYLLYAKNDDGTLMFPEFSVQLTQPFGILF